MINLSWLSVHVIRNIVQLHLPVMYPPTASREPVSFVTCTQGFVFNWKIVGSLETPVLRLCLPCTFFLPPHGGSVML